MKSSAVFKWNGVFCTYPGGSTSHPKHNLFSYYFRYKTHTNSFWRSCLKRYHPKPFLSGRLETVGWKLHSRSSTRSRTGFGASNAAEQRTDHDENNHLSDVVPDLTPCSPAFYSFMAVSPDRFQFYFSSVWYRVGGNKHISKFLRKCTTDKGNAISSVNNKKEIYNLPSNLLRIKNWPVVNLNY